MDYSNVRTSRASLEGKSPTSHYRSGRVFLLDNRRASARPLLYQLSDHVVDSLFDINCAFRSLRSSQLIAVGSVLSVDREKRIIYLDCGDCVFYEHLITAAQGTQALSSSIRALRVQLRSNDNLRKKEQHSSMQNSRLLDRTRVQNASTAECKLPEVPVNVEGEVALSAPLNGHNCTYEIHF